MTSPPDKLFRQGLEHYQKPAPGSAWERIESGLDRKRNRIPWLKIAAGLLILIASTTVILQFNRTDTSIATVSKESGPVSSQQSAVSSLDSVVNRESSDVNREKHLSPQVRRLANIAFKSWRSRSNGVMAQKAPLERAWEIANPKS